MHVWYKVGLFGLWTRLYIEMDGGLTETEIRLAIMRDYGPSIALYGKYRFENHANAKGIYRFKPSYYWALSKIDHSDSLLVKAMRAMDP